MKGILTLFLCSLAVLSFAQKSPSPTDIDARLLEVYEAEYLTRLQTDNPFLLQRWSFYLNESFYVSTYPAEKGTPDFPTVIISDLENINILQLEKDQNLSHDFNRQTMYKIQGTDKVLVYRSGKEFNHRLRKHLSEK